MISVDVLWRWATASNEQAVANARAATTECSQRRVERAEVEQFLRGLVEGPEVAVPGAAASR